MTQSLSVKRLAAIAVTVWSLASSATLTAQLIKAPLTDGFARTSSIEMSVDEMLGTSKFREADQPILGPGFPALWIAEIQYKPMRLVRMPVTDPKTGKTSQELIWYLVYRIIPRDYTELAGDGREALVKKLKDPDRDPANEIDPLRATPLQMPRFALRLEDEGAEGELMDEVNLQVQNAVFQREMGRRAPDLKLHNSIQAIGEVSEPVSISDPNPLSKATYGVAIWRNIDPKTDYFSIYISGLTNAYKISAGTGTEQVVEEKVVVQKFARPGDEFLQEESEFRLIDSSDTDNDQKPDQTYPFWTYRPRKAVIEVPEVDSVLRNARKDSNKPKNE